MLEFMRGEETDQSESSMILTDQSQARRQAQGLEAERPGQGHTREVRGKVLQILDGPHEAEIQLRVSECRLHSDQ